jgi:3-isopropylmalate/(R)-2-methylmalate dehydratase large subunit
MTGPRTLFEKIWERHRIVERSDGQSLLYVDRHFVHEGSRRAFEILAEKGLPVRRPDRTFGTADHYAPTTSRRIESLADPEQRAMMTAFGQNIRAHGFTAFELDDPRQGIVHVIGPELGLSLPGMVIVCGDSHTATHGAMGALAFGIGASEVSHVLATQTIWQARPKTMRVRFDGALPRGVHAKDMILAMIARISAAGGTGHVIEYAGEAISALSVEGRLTVCNMSIEAGARAGLVAPDEKTFAYAQGRPYAPKGKEWEEAVAYWRTLPSDAGARYDTEVAIDAASLAPMVTWGTSPEQAASVGDRVPDPAGLPDAARRAAAADALSYMGLEPGTALKDVAVQHVFIGSCTNSRLEDLAVAAEIVRGRKVAAGVRAMAVPGSEQVKREAEAKGIDRILRDAGFEWRSSGCSMCVGMNGDLVPPFERCASTSNRNFVGRQGKNARTHLVSPATAAATAVMGRFADARELGA